MAPSADAHKKSSKEMCKLHSSKFTENFKGIVLNPPLLSNVNCAKILAKKFDFIACVKSM